MRNWDFAEAFKGHTEGRGRGIRRKFHVVPLITGWKERRKF